MAKLTQFISESRAELKKVIWPKKDEVIKSTGVVIIVVIIVSSFLFLSDLSIEAVMDIFFK